jgi:hypothetical protein
MTGRDEVAEFRHLNSDPSAAFRIFDPLLGEIDERGGHGDFLGGYEIRPKTAAATRADLRILSIGNAATAWPGQDWSARLARRLASEGRSVAVWNGAGRQGASVQEMLRVLRDAPAIRPHLVLTLTGAVDATLGPATGTFPFQIGRPTRLEGIIRRADVAATINLGFPDEDGPAAVWCRHQRLIDRAAAELGARHLAFLQPVLGLGRGTPSPREQTILDALARRGGASGEGSRLDDLRGFYEEVRAAIAAAPAEFANVVDLGDLLADRPDSFTDAWTLTETGLEALETAIAEAILARWPTLPPPPPRPSFVVRHDLRAAERILHAPIRVVAFRPFAASPRSGPSAALADDPRIADFADNILGASTLVGAMAALDETDFSRFDLCLVEVGPNEEIALQAGRTDLAATRDRLLDIVDRAAAAGKPTVFVVQPAANRFRFPRPLRDLLIGDFRTGGLPVLDLYALVERAATERDVPIAAFFDGPLKLKAAVEARIGRFLVDRIVAIAHASKARPRPVAGWTHRRTRHLPVATLVARGPYETLPADPRAGVRETVRFGDGAALRIAGDRVDRVEGILFAQGEGAGVLVDPAGAEVWNLGPAGPREARTRRTIVAHPIAGRPAVPPEGLDLVVRVAAGIEGPVIAGVVVGLAENGRETRVVACDAAVVVMEKAADAATLRALAAATVAVETTPSPSTAPPVPLDRRSPEGGDDDSLPVRDFWRDSWVIARVAVADPRAAFDMIRARLGLRTRGDQEVSEVSSSKIGMFDPLLGQVNARGEHPHFRGGYKIWPDAARTARAKFRIMTIGNSTSLWPAYPWSLFLGKNLRAAGRSVAIFNGAGKGHSSSQELLRVVRDAPAIRPHLIVALSGICDVGYLVNAKNYPFLHKYSRDLMELVKTTGYAAAVNSGYPDSASPAEIWCRNQRLARVLAAELGIEYLTILQPVMGYGRYERSPAEEEMFRQKAAVVLKSYDRPYGEAIREFYDEVLERIAAEPERYPHVVNLIDVFADARDVYKDHRHPTEEGCKVLAAAIEKIVLERFTVPMTDDSDQPPVKVAEESAQPVEEMVQIEKEEADEEEDEDETGGALDLEVPAAVAPASSVGVAPISPPPAEPEPEMPAEEAPLEPAVKPRVVLSGTSNSILTQGFSSAVAEDPRIASFANHSLGASGTVAVGYHLRDIDFSKYDVCLIEYCVNEEVFLLLGETTLAETIDNMCNLVDRAARAGCRAFFVVMPSRNRFRFRRPFQDWLETVMRAHGVPVIDTYSILMRAVEAHRLQIPQLFLDPVHLKRAVAVVLGRFIADEVVRIAAEPIPILAVDAALTHRPVEYIPASALRLGGGAKLIERQSRLVSAELAEIPAGATVAWSDTRGGEICGIVYDQTGSHGRLEDAATGTILHSGKDPEPGRVGRFTLVANPLTTNHTYEPGGFELRVAKRAATDDCFRIAGFVIRPAVEPRPTAFLPVSERLRVVESFATPQLIEEIAAAAVQG